MRGSASGFSRLSCRRFRRTMESVQSDPVPEGSLMSRRILLAAVVTLVAAAPTFAQNRPKEELVDQVKDSINNAVRFLKQQQRAGSDWERGVGNIAGNRRTTGRPKCPPSLTPPHPPPPPPHPPPPP